MLLVKRWRDYLRIAARRQAEMSTEKRGAQHAAWHVNTPLMRYRAALAKRLRLCRSFHNVI
jgi:hypothetical protein